MGGDNLQTSLPARSGCSLYAKIFSIPKYAGGKERKKTIITISPYVLQFTCFPVPNMPSSFFLVAHRWVAWPLAAIVSASALFCKQVGLCVSTLWSRKYSNVNLYFFQICCPAMPGTTPLQATATISCVQVQLPFTCEPALPQTSRFPFAMKSYAKGSNCVRWFRYTTLKISNKHQTKVSAPFVFFPVCEYSVLVYSTGFDFFHSKIKA